MRNIKLIIITLSLLFSCAKSNQLIVNNINSISSEKLKNTTIIPRWDYLILRSEYNEKSYSCTYYIKNEEFKFSEKIDSLFKYNLLNQDSLKANFKEKINLYLSSKATYLEGKSNRVSFYYGYKNVYVKFFKEPDTVTLNSYFVNEKYRLIENIYFCRAKNHLKRYI